MAEKKSVSVKVLNMAGEEVSKMNLNAEKQPLKLKSDMKLVVVVKSHGAKKAQAALVQVAAAPQSGSVAEQSSDQLEIKTSRFPKTKKNINLRSSPR